MLTISRKPLGMWFVTVFALFASLVTALTIAPSAHAAVQGTWKNQTTITYNNKDYTESQTSQGNRYYAPPNQKLDLSRISFPVNENLDQQNLKGTYYSNINNRDLATEITFTNLRIDASKENPTNPPPATTDTTDKEEVDSCAIDGVGWIVCPVARFLSATTDGAYSLAENLLVFRISEQPFSTDSKINPTYTIWSNIRNLANVGFIFAFFIIIFSQATSIGISNYGIKKMLPRLVVAAILVNLSYYLCVFAVDVSNIVGKGLDGVIKGATLRNLPAPNDGKWEDVMSTILTGGAAIFAVIAVLYAALGTALAFLVASLLAIFTAIIVLAARQAFLIILIVLSPLAFVAYILPNTEDLFNKWRKAFTALLVMYPLVAVIFAGSQVASQVMLATAPTDKSNLASYIIPIAALGVLAIPLFALPFIVKFSGGVIGRVAGMVNDRNKGLVDRARNKGKEVSGNTAFARGRNIRQQAKKEFKNQQYTERLAGSSKGLRARYTQKASGGLTQFVHDDIARDPIASSLPGMATAQAGREAQINALQKVAVAQEAKAFNERVASYRTAYEQQPMDIGRFGTALQNAMRSGNREESAALIGHLASAGGASGRAKLEDVLSSTAVTDERTQIAVNNAIYRDNYSGLLAKRGGIAKGGFDSSGVWQIHVDKLGTEALASQDSGSLRKNYAQISQAEAIRVLANEELKSKIPDAIAEDVLRARAAGLPNPHP